MKLSATLLDWTRASCLGLVFCLGACGTGGGGGHVASTAAPPPAQTLPPPPPPPLPLVSPVEFVDAPATQEFTVFSSGDALRIRYDAQTGKYEAMAPGRDWDALVDDPQSEPGLSFFASAPDINSGFVSGPGYFDRTDPALRYHYSSLASWGRDVPGSSDMRHGIIAFGTPTPAGAVPVTGSATYQGQIAGSASVPALSGWGDSPRAPVGGSVSLQFDFGKGSLAGQIRPGLACDCEPIEFPTLDFAATTFAVGSRNYSGTFATAVGGPNSFSGIFTGPHAEELIGQWAFPFMFEGTPQSAEGVWIAKRGN